VRPRERTRDPTDASDVGAGMSATMSPPRPEEPLVPTCTAQLTTPASTDQAFAYLAQFDNTQQWDPGVSSARPLGDGPPALGSRYAVTVELGGGAEELIYEITEYDPPRRVVLVADGSKFVSHDEISVAPDAEGSHVTYRAELSLKGLIKIGAPFAGRALRTAGDAAVAGLTRELTRLGG
jgi:hypothetical protein